MTRAATRRQQGSRQDESGAEGAQIHGLLSSSVPEGLGGVQHVAISVTPDVFEATKKRLDDAGVKYLGPDMGVQESIYFKDPDNIQVEFIRQPLMEVPESAPQDD